MSRISGVNDLHHTIDHRVEIGEMPDKWSGSRYLFYRHHSNLQKRSNPNTMYPPMLIAYSREAAVVGRGLHALCNYDYCTDVAPAVNLL